jgi:hypothetical protein
VLSTPGIALQEKQSHAYKRAVQARTSGRKGNTVSAKSIEKEHNKFRPGCPHLFVFITDKRVVPKAHAALAENELAIDSNNEVGFYGPLLARLKLHHDREENVLLADPTEALKSWLAASASSAVSPTAAESSRPRKRRRSSVSVQQRQQQSSSLRADAENRKKRRVSNNSMRGAPDTANGSSKGAAPK